MSVRLPSLAAGCALALLAAGAQAADLGVRGATWAIAEPDLLEALQARLGAMERSGSLARLEAEARARAIERMEAPEAVPGIVPATVARTRRFDPGVVLDRALVAPDGTLIAARGTRIDPLAGSAFSRELLFIDGRRGVEVEWALAREGSATIVLLAGRPLALGRRHGRAFFFDQGGRIAARLGLRVTPSRVTREGRRLRIDEVPLEDRDGAVSRNRSLEAGR